MTKRPRRILGLTPDGKPLDRPNDSTVVHAPMGHGKTTNVAVPAVFITDVKDAEVARHIGEMLRLYHQKCGVVDVFGVVTGKRDD